MKVTNFGTTMLLFDDGASQVLFDCHITRPSLLKCIFGKFETNYEVADKILETYDFSKLKAIFISHSHHDHVLDCPYFAKKTNAKVYGSISTLNVCRGGNVTEDNLGLFETNKPYNIGDFQITVIPSIHSKAHWYNNDLGQVIDSPVIQPAKKKAYKEGGSFDFIIQHHNKKYVIRPSYNFIEGQFDNITADVLFLGVGGLSKDNPNHTEQFFKETIDKINPSLVIPVHWDNFFIPLFGPIRSQPKLMEDTGKSLFILSQYCGKQNINCLVQPPLSSIDIPE